jgi:hypothetical protein
MQTAKVLALLLPDSAPETPHVHPLQLGRNAMALMRGIDGRMTVEEVTADDAFMAKLLDTGCFRRGKPIMDPMTREVMGYEMEMIAKPMSRTKPAAALA